MSLSFITAAAAENWSHIREYVCQARGKNYCLIHKRYFEISWCPECGRSTISALEKLLQSMSSNNIAYSVLISRAHGNKHSSFPFYTSILYLQQHFTQIVRLFLFHMLFFFWVKMWNKHALCNTPCSSFHGMIWPLFFLHVTDLHFILYVCVCMCIISSNRCFCEQLL